MTEKARRISYEHLAARQSDILDSTREHLCAMRIVAEDVEAGAGWRQQHCIAALSQIGGALRRPLQRFALNQFDSGRCKGGMHALRITTDPQYGARVFRA